MANQQPKEIICTPWLIERSGMDLLLLAKMLLTSTCSCTKTVKEPTNCNNSYFKLTHICIGVRAPSDLGGGEFLARKNA